MATNPNADDYANNRINIFFPGHPDSLTGQCVSLVKWFLGEMCGISNWTAARGNAKDYGDQLVREGIAYVVPEAQRKRGDIVVWKNDGAGYGHIAVLLSGDRVFEENVGIAGSTRGVFGGNVVYASRIDPLYQNWRKGGATFYRVRNYIENIQTEDEPMIRNVDNEFGRWSKLYNQIRNTETPPTREQFIDAAVGRSWLQAMEILSDNPSSDASIENRVVGRQARADNWPQQIRDRTAERDSVNAELSKAKEQLANSVSKTELAKAQAAIADAEARAKSAQAALDAKIKEDSATTTQVDGFLRTLWKKITGGK